MAEAVVSFVVQTIGNLLIEEARFLWGVKGKVKDLQKELKLIQCLLRDADAKREHSPAVLECVAQLRDTAYDAEDIIEQYILKIAPKKERNIIKAYACFVAKCTCVQARAVGIEIDGLTSRISSLRASMQAYGIQMVSDGNREKVRASTWRHTYAHFEEDIVGRQDNIEVLVKEMLKDGKQHRVISIWGMGGLGKTTLAKKVIARDEVKDNFDGVAWACVSQEYHWRDILVGILTKLDPDQRGGLTNMRDDDLFENLYKIQQKKRCIVVLDDIWTKQAWDELRAAFPVENTRSKLLITTRNKEVAEYIDPHGFLLELQCLSDQESWELLMKRVFLETNEITDNMKTIGYELLKKCGGLPLAIVVLGGLLIVNKWETVSKKISLYLSDKSDVSKVLALSYDDLPWHLKPCFLYLGSFPEDMEISVAKVLHMWIAEGFVSTAYDEEREITLEDVAEKYLMELVNRGMVQVQFNVSGKIKTCHLHDLVRDLCISKARQDKFLSILKVQEDDEWEDSSSSRGIEGESTCTTRRLSLIMRMSIERLMIPIEQIGRPMLYLRTLMFFASVKEKWDQSQWEQFQPIFINCRFLRVLKLENFYWMIGNLPESVGDLVHLRFLSLARSGCEGLPQSIENLVFMEFLELNVLPNVVVTVPNVLWKMRRLRYLRLPYGFAVKEKFNGDRKKLRLDTLKNLQTLRNFSSANCDVNDVGKLTNLQKLSVIAPRGHCRLEIIPQLAKFKLKHLQSSAFIFICNSSFTEGELSKTSSYCHSCKLTLQGKIEKLPEHKNFPQQLRKLVLFGSELEEDPMPILEKLHHLVILMLCRSFVGKEMVCSTGGFPQLKHLVLAFLENLEELRAAEGAMPHLSRLGISECPNLKTVPQGVYTDDGSLYLFDELYVNTPVNACQKVTQEA